MKRAVIALLGILIISGVSLLTFSSCDKDTDCKLKVQVVRKGDGKAIQGAKVTVSKGPSTKRAEGRTDASGIFEATFAAPAIFDVEAMIELYEDVTETDTLGVTTTTTEKVGECIERTSVRLKDGEEVETTLKLDYMPTTRQ